jgi:hypothetical protein
MEQMQLQLQHLTGLVEVLAQRVKQMKENTSVLTNRVVIMDNMLNGFIGTQVFSIEQRNDVFRQKNRTSGHNSTWYRLMNADGEVPENFLALKRQILVIDDDLLAELLQFYNLGLQGGQQARRQRLFKFLGV